MRFVSLTIVFFMLNAWTGMGYWSCAGVVIWLWYLIDLFENSNNRIAFKEFILVLYGLNYLFSPALSYLLDHSSFYRMKLPEGEYFTLAIPCILLLQYGMNMIPTKAFQFDFKTGRLKYALTQNILVSWIFIGTGLRVVAPLMPSGLDFFVYLLSGIRFVAAFGLYMFDPKKFKWHILGVLGVELSFSLANGMFHDSLLWIILFGIFWLFLKKPSRKLKLIIGVSLALCVYILQITKSAYREQLGEGRDEAGVSSFEDAVSKNVNGNEGLFEGSKATTSITRVNQAWILASTANRMNRVRDFQELTIVKKYLESAFLPRLLAPDKLMSGDKQIFNKFSGHHISPGTSMGLGLLADGYVAYGQIGSYAFSFILGMIFSFIFKCAERWSKISPFFILFIFPILNYAVRPDSETQTIMGHIVKGLFVYGFLAKYYGGYFSRKVREAMLEQEKAEVRAAQLRKISVRGGRYA